MKCKNCGIDFDPKRDTAKFCSPNCRVVYNRRVSVTQNPEKISVTATEAVSVTFKFTVKYNRSPGDEGYDEETAKARQRIREAVYWYDVPLGAVPVREEGWPEMPEYMNGRQYFLWMKNNFNVKDGLPEIINPYPQYDNVRVEMGGEGSRRWGA